MNLRDYQTTLKTDIYTAWGTGARVVCGVLPTGGGKTVVFSEILKEFPGICFAIAHRQELLSQISLALARDEVPHRIVSRSNIIKWIDSLHYAEFRKSFINPHARCVVLGVDTLLARADKLRELCESAGLWIIDECFPAGTLVDGRPIEQILPGDFVTAFDPETGTFHEKKVTRIFKNPAPKCMVRFEAAPHHVIKCTIGHPIWTQRGWVCAANLREGDFILGTKNFMHNVPSARRFDRVSPAQTVRSYGARVLFERMRVKIPRRNFFKNNGENKSNVCVGAYAKKEPHAPCGYPPQGFKNFKSYWAPAESSGRKWPRFEPRRISFIRKFRAVGVSSAFCNKNGSQTKERKTHSVALQDRLGPPRLEARHRSGRRKPRDFRAPGARPEKRNVFGWHRVGRVEVYERRNFERVGESSKYNFVYNIEVDGFHTYTANGIVVHNCHHILQKNKWGKAVDLFPNARGLGVTATPVRADGKGLGREFDGVIDCLVEGPPMRELIDRGFLTDYRIFAPPSDLDLSDVPLTASGDYNPQAAKRAVRRSRIIGDVVKHYLKIAPGKLGVTFATDVETASDISKKFQEAGVPAAVLHAKTPDRLRVETIRRFAAGELKQLVNVDLFGEGFDLPAIECVSFARPTESYGLYSQQFGRVLRPMDGKDAALIIDHVGNVSRHWLPDAKRTWSLARRDRRARKTDPELIPVKNCVSCFRVYEAVHRVCPFCGHFPEPTARSAPEFVDGDLTELDEAALARLRGEIARIDSAPKFPVHASREARFGIVKNHNARQKAQGELRDKIAWWAGWQRARGRSDSESYRRFFHGFGVDVMTAQTLGRPEAAALTAEIEKTLKEYERG